MSSKYLPGYNSSVKALTDQASIWNKNLKFNYLSYFYNSFLVNLNAHPDTAPQTPNVPEASWVLVGALADPNNASDQDILDALPNLDIEQTGPPVVAIPSFSLPVIVPSTWFHAG